MKIKLASIALLSMGLWGQSAASVQDILKCNRSIHAWQPKDYAQEDNHDTRPIGTVGMLKYSQEAYVYVVVSVGGKVYVSWREDVYDSQYFIMGGNRVKAAGRLKRVVGGLSLDCETSGDIQIADQIYTAEYAKQFLAKVIGTYHHQSTKEKK